MKLYTSFYGNLRNIPSEFFIVSASRGLTEALKLAVDSWDIDLAPTQSIFNDYKSDGDWAKYVMRFKADVLPKIDWLEKLEKWEETANKLNKTLDNIVLLCYESPFDNCGRGQFCHRFILSEHFEKEFKTEVKEYGYENMVRDNYKLTLANNMDILF